MAGAGPQGASASSSAAAGGGAYHLQLQLDIERMFSRKIDVFSAEAVSLSSDALLGAVLKVSNNLFLHLAHCV